MDAEEVEEDKREEIVVDDEIASITVVIFEEFDEVEIADSSKIYT